MLYVILLLCLKKILCQKIARKGTIFCAHSQIKCTKSLLLCTKTPFCAIKSMHGTPVIPFFLCTFVGNYDRPCYSRPHYGRHQYR